MSGLYPGERLLRGVRRLVVRTWSSLARGAGEAELRSELEGASDALLERGRDAQGWPWMAALGQDARYALRRVRRQPGFHLVVVLTLALGIGVNTGIFALWNALMLRPLPVRDPQSLQLLQWQARHFPHFSEFRTAGECAYTSGPGEARGCNFSVPYYQALRATPVFSSLSALYAGGRLDFAWNGEPLTASSQYVSGDYFSTLGVLPAAGRLLTPADDQPQAPATVVLGYRFWQDALGGSPAVVGAQISLNGWPAQVVGVAASSFTALVPGSQPDLWAPLALIPRMDHAAEADYASPRFAIVAVVGRLAPGVSGARATAAASLAWSRAVLAGPRPMLAAADVPAVTLLPAGQALTGSRTIYAQPLLLLMAAVGLILLLACVNVAGLLLARGATRSHEIALRRALGASQGRIFRQLLTESLALTASGLLSGLAVAYACARGIAAAVAANAGPALPAPRLWDARVLWFASAAALLAGLLSGVWPARAAARASSGGRQGRRAFGWAAAQVALSSVILVCTALLVRTLHQVEATGLGFDPSRLITFGVNPGGLGFGGSARNALYTQLRQRLRALPGVEAVGTSMAPLVSTTLAQGYGGRRFHDREGRELVADELDIGPGYLQAANLPLLSGRLFQDADLVTPAAQPQPAVISRQLAQALFGDGYPVGRILGARAGPHPNPGEIVVGVVGDAKFASVRAPVAPVIYVPYEGATAYFSLRTSTRLAGLLPAIRRTVAAVNPNLPVFQARSGAANVAEVTFQERMLAGLTSGLGGLALLLACLGLYGILAHDVARRQRELGIRMALGASGGMLARGVIGRSLAVTGIGIAAGAAATWPCAQALRSFLYGVAPSDPLAWSAALGLLLGVGVAASAIPAGRALASDAAAVMRAE